MPFQVDDRRPMISDRVLFVPEYYDKHQEWAFPGWDDPSLFGKKGPLFIEYCTGNGTWIAQKALQEPNCLWVAVEKRFDRVRKIWSKMQNLKLNNLIVVAGEALTFSRFYLADDAAEAIYINFPDPWPKDRHAKHRLLQEPFITELSRVVKKEGTATFVSDDLPYCGQMVEGMLGNPLWRPSFADPYYVTEWPDYGTSYFDNLWRGKGRSIQYMQFRNNK